MGGGINAGVGGPHAQPFETGKNPTGYTLTRIQIWGNLTGTGTAPSTDTITVTLRADSSGDPASGTPLATFLPPTTWVKDGLNEFKLATPANLDPDETYYIHIDASESTFVGKRVTDQANVGSAPDWSFSTRLGTDSDGDWEVKDFVFVMELHGTIKATAFVDFSDLQADHTSPIGMWSPDGSTLWVGQWFSTQVYAYNLADETANYSENWTLHKPATLSESNRKPTGIWSNGTHIYVTDPDHGRVFQYNFGDKTLTSTTHSLHADNGNRQGLWSDGTTAWVSDNADDKLYAYQLSDFSRQSDKDIDLHSDNVEARGIWSDGTTIWVLDSSEEKIYAYLLSDGSRDSGLDIDLDGAGVNYNSIWSDGTTMYVVENTGGSASRDPQIHKLPLPAQDETVAWNATLTSADNWALGSVYTYDGYGSSALGSITTTQGSLSPDSFTVGTTIHTVELLGVRGGTDNRLYLITDTAVTKSDLAGYAMEFTVDGSTTTLQVKDATDESNLGFYWAESLHSFGPDDWQAKTITVKLRTPVVDDCAGDTTTTCSVSLGSSVTGDIELVADTDYFSLSVTSGARYQIDAEGSETSMGTLADPFLILRDASETELALNDDGGDGRNARIVWAASSTRTVYVEVNQAFHNSTGTYTLTVSVGPADDCANNTTTTCSVSPGTPVTGDIQYSGDDDYFSLSVASGITYQIDAEGSPTSMGTLGDPSLELRDASGTEFATNDDGGTGYNARLTWTADRTGTVYVRIESADGGTGTYTLTVSVSNNPATGAPTISGTAQVGQTLTAATSGISDADGLGTFSYQWKADGADISGATSATYTLTSNEQGKMITVTVSFTDAANNAETLTSAVTAAVTATATPVADDCADDTTTTCSVSPGSSVTGDIEVASDVDYFRLSVTSGLTYHIDMEGSPTSMGTLANPFIRLRDATVNSIDTDDNGGAGLNARLIWTADRTGTVYLLASENSRPSETGTYTLTVSVPPQPPASRVAAGPIGTGTSPSRRNSWMRLVNMRRGAGTSWRMDKSALRNWRR